MYQLPTKEGNRLIIIPFCGFYNSSADQMLQNELERAFDYDDSQNSNIPDAVYWSREYGINWDDVREKFCIEYLDAFLTQLQGEAGIKLTCEFESLQSPREYNFTSDRLFAWITVESVNLLFAESEKDKHVNLAENIKARFTSRSGFISGYSNDIAEWLAKPVLDWDHNELMTLLEAVMSIKLSESDIDNYFHCFSLMEYSNCNGQLSNWVWDAMPEKTRDFANLQREYGKPIDWDVFIETGQAFDPESGEKMPDLRCKETLELPLTTTKE